MEAKLRQLEKSTPEAPLHPSLPPKPMNVPPTVSDALPPNQSKSERQSNLPSTPLPSFPILNPQSLKSSSTGVRPLPSASVGTSNIQRRGVPISGIKMVKQKPKNA